MRDLWILNNEWRTKSQNSFKDSNKTYLKTPIPLNIEDIYSLISVLLSAQCTDVNVNNVTKIFIQNITTRTFC